MISDLENENDEKEDELSPGNIEIQNSALEKIRRGLLENAIKKLAAENPRILKDI